MNIQALVFDLDGTAIPKSPDGMPSQRVIDAVALAKQKCHVSVATGRPLSICEHVLEALQIDNLCILNGGTQLYSRDEKRFVWRQEIESQVLTELYAQLEAFSEYKVADEKRMSRVPLVEYRTDEAVGLSCIFEATREDAEAMAKIVKSFDALTVAVMSSWKDGTFDVHITHELATKKHALQSLLSHLNVDIDQTMVVGDGGNDLPLFELAGWKVAMSNGAEELKAEADWIAPHVDDDGLAVAIEKFVLER